MTEKCEARVDLDFYQYENLTDKHKLQFGRSFCRLEQSAQFFLKAFKLPMPVKTEVCFMSQQLAFFLFSWLYYSLSAGPSGRAV